MKNILGVVALCVIFGQWAWAGDFAAAAKRLETVIQNSGLEKGDLGVFVSEDGETALYELNGDKHFIPASITKLFTAATTLNTLTPFYTFHTQLYVDGVQSGSTLKGNLYLKGGGDPAFVSEKMWMLVDDFIRTGIKKIKGNIVADDSFLDGDRFDPGREPDRNDRAYDAPIAGLSFNWNSTTIYVRPGAHPGDKAQVWIDPQNDYVVLKNDVRTSAHGVDLQATRQALADKDVITVHGKIAVGSEEKHIFKNITNPPLYAGANLKRFLEERGITVTGSVSAGKTPPAARLAADEEGDPLARLIKDMDKFSNNFVAETLAKDLGAIKVSQPGHMADGLKAVRSFLTDEVRLNPDDFSLVNVSGFTRKNSFSPKQFVRLLSWVQHHFRIYPEFVQSLPVAGVDGTLKKRMADSDAAGWVRAKTGLLRGVVALAGYAGRHDDGTVMFAFIYNGHENEARVRGIFDSMAASLVK